MAKFVKNPLGENDETLLWKQSQDLENRIEDVVDEITDEIYDRDGKVKRYGVRRKLGATTPELERLGDAIGLVANADTSLTTYNEVQNDFDNIFPWSHMRKCIIEEDGTIIYEGYPGYGTSNGDYMIEIPSFYLKHTVGQENLEYWVSEYSGQGYEKTDKFYIAQFKTSEGHRSRPSASPLVFTELSTFRNNARNKGDGWQVIDMKGHYILRVLYQIEFAHLDSQAKLGAGVPNVRYRTTDEITVAKDNTNTIDVSSDTANGFEVGETVTIGTSRGSASAIAHDRIITEKTSTTITVNGAPFNVAVGNIIYNVGQHSGKTLELTSSSGQSVGRSGRQSISYRGVEDVFGNVYENVDGTLINNHQAYTCEDPSKFANSITSDYKAVGYTNLDSNAWVSEMGYDEDNKFVEFPIKGGAGSSTGYCDHYYQEVGLRAPRGGGNFNNGTLAGLFFWVLYNAPAASLVTSGARLLYRKP